MIISLKHIMVICYVHMIDSTELNVLQNTFPQTTILIFIADNAETPSVPIDITGFANCFRMKLSVENNLVET